MMEHRFKLLNIVFIIVLFGLYNCVEEFDFKTSAKDEGKGLLVVEATLTDQFIRQKVFLSRSDTRFDLETDTIYSYIYPLGIGNRDSVIDEQNARVTVVSENGVSYNFFEDESGVYLSQEPFALQLNKEYKLDIETSDGSTYSSPFVGINNSADILDVNVERTLNDNGVEGLEISVNSEPSVGIPNLYRYTYEETFKIIAPKWNPQKFLLENYDPCGDGIVATYDLSVVDKEVQDQICYKTVLSNSIIQNTNIDDLGRVNSFPIRFINRDNFIITHRYSIIVRQYIQSEEAYNFYNILGRLSSSESVFSQIQTGALLANVTNKNNISEPVLGFVEATSISEKRIFFNYEDYFPDEDLPPFPFNCREPQAPEGHASYCSNAPNTCPQSLVERLNFGLITYTGVNHEPTGCGLNFIKDGPFLFTARVCGDCLILGENTAPDFWVE